MFFYIEATMKIIIIFTLIALTLIAIDDLVGRQRPVIQQKETL
jgi:hypothetical protein